ncbi:MAG: hypothetical protein ACK4IK_03500 [Bacteroidia bacterium]
MQDYGMRPYNPMEREFSTTDPLYRNFPWNSTYSFAENDVIRSIDLEGMEKYIVHLYYNEDKTSFSKVIISRMVDVNGKVLENSLKSKGIKITEKDVMIRYHEKDGKLIGEPQFRDDLSRGQKEVLRRGTTVSRPMETGGFGNDELNGKAFKNASMLTTTGYVDQKGMAASGILENPNDLINKISKNILKNVDPNSVMDIDIQFSTKQAEIDFGAKITQQLKSQYPDANITIKVDIEGLQKTLGTLYNDKKGNPNAVGMTVTTINKEEQK